MELFHLSLNKEITFSFKLPVFTENVITWRNTEKALMHTAFSCIESDIEIFFEEKPQEERMDLIVSTPQEIAIHKLEKAIADGLRSWFYDAQKEIDHLTIQLYIDKWFASGDEWRVLKQSRIAKEDQNSGIIIDPTNNQPGHMARVMSRIFNPNYHGLLDLNSTSIGDKINESFRFSSDALVKDKRIVSPENGNPFCQITNKHAIGLGMLPRRAYLLRTTFESALDLLEPELPLVTPYKEDETNILHGRNLRTAFMHLGIHTHEDGIAMSQSAANHMIASRMISQLIESHMPITPLIKKGEYVSPGMPIALDGKEPVLANKLHCAAVVDEICQQTGSRLGEETNRCWIKYNSFYPLNNGDKLSNRHGGKGVVIVIPDEDMPKDEQGNLIDVCIGPETITNRKAMSILWEMMLSRKATQEGKDIYVEMLKVTNDGLDWNRDSLHDFKTLAEQYSDKEQLYLNGLPLPEKTFVASLFWIRLDKIAREIVNAVNKTNVKNNFGGKIDKASKSGQRCNIAKLMALSARGLDNIVEEIVFSNMTAQDHFGNIIDAIRNYDSVDIPEKFNNHDC